MKSPAIKVFFLLFFIFLPSQKKDPRFDSLLIKQAEKMLSNNVSRQKIIMWNIQMLKKAEKEQYKKGVIWANINLGVQYYNLSKPDISINYLNTAKKLADAISADQETYAKIYQEFSQVYFTMGLYDISLKYSYKAKHYGEKLIETPYKHSFLSYAYRTRSNILLKTKKDSSLHYIHKAISTFENPSNYSILANYYIQKNIHIDSAKIYLIKAEKMYHNSKNVNKYNLSVLYYFFGNLSLKEKKYEEAIAFLEKL